MRALPGTRQTRRPESPAKPRRLRHRRGLRGEIPGHQPVLPARRRRPPAEPAAVGHGDLAAQDARGQARLDGDENGGPLQGHHRDPGTGRAPASRPSASARETRSPWSHGSAASPSNGARTRSSPTALPAGTLTPARRSSPGSSGTGANYASTAARCRCTTSPGSPTSHTPATGQPAWARLMAAKTAQVPRGLPALPRPDPCRTATSRNHQPRRKSPESRMPGNLARPVRRGAVRKRTRELRAPRRTAYPTVWPVVIERPHGEDCGFR